jgi:hypothetical protein
MKKTIELDGVKYVGREVGSKERLMVGTVVKIVDRVPVEEWVWKPRFTKVIFQQERVPKPCLFESEWHEWPDVDGAWAEAEEKLRNAPIRVQPLMI